MLADIALSGRRSLPLALRHVHVTVHLTDAIGIVVTSLWTGILYRYATHEVLGEVSQFAATGALVAVLFVGANAITVASRPEELLRPMKQVRNAFATWLFALLVVLGTAFAWHVSSDFSRGAVTLFFAAGISLTAASRLLWSSALQSALKNGRLKARRTAVLVPSGPHVQKRVERELEILRRHGYTPMWQLPISSIDQVENDGRSHLPELLRGTNVDELVILGDWSEMPRVLESSHFDQLPVPVRLMPLGSASVLGTRRREKLGDAALIELQRGSLSGAERAAKACFDKGTAFLLLLPLVPLFALVGLLIRMESPGPVFFRQTRRGFNGRPFEIWKFRTMRVAVEGSMVRQAVVNDPRVTRVGRWLRQMSIDELPQLINVLRGEMSMVGPRPHALSHDDHYYNMIANYARRQHVLPGLTGLAQIKGARGETPTVDHMKRRVELDLWYVKNWTFRRDLWILICTVWHIFTTRSAY